MPIQGEGMSTDKQSNAKRRNFAEEIKSKNPPLSKEMNYGVLDSKSLLM